MILDYLVTNLIENNVNFVLLKDDRCPKLSCENSIQNLNILTTSFKFRYRYYKSHIHDFRFVLCFGNIPPYIKLDIPVYTYIHNVNLLKIPSNLDFKTKIISLIKRQVIRLLRHNSTGWIVQTSNTKNLVNEKLSSKNQPIYEFPFYKHAKIIKKNQPRTDYIFVGDVINDAKGHSYLIDAWIKLHEIGIDSRLHLTVTDPQFIRLIDSAVSKGVQIINHGLIPFSKVNELYNNSKATIYPSMNESLGLGIIEAVEAGCDVIGVDLPYMHAVCRPSLLFKPQNSDSIVDAVINYEKGLCDSTTLTIHDTINDFISFINK